MAPNVRDVIEYVKGHYTGFQATDTTVKVTIDNLLFLCIQCDKVSLQTHSTRYMHNWLNFYYYVAIRDFIHHFVCYLDILHLDQHYFFLIDFVSIYLSKIYSRIDSSASFMNLHIFSFLPTFFQAKDVNIPIVLLSTIKHPHASLL